MELLNFILVNFFFILFVELSVLLFLKTSEQGNVNTYVQIILHPHIHIQNSLIYCLFLISLLCLSYIPITNVSLNDFLLIYCYNEILEFGQQFCLEQMFTTYIQLLLIVTAFIIHLLYMFYIKYQKHAYYEYGIILQYAVIFLLFFYESFNMIMLIINLVGVSTMLYTLLSIETKEHGREAAIKYYLLSALTSGLIIYGIFLLLNAYQSLDYNTINFFSWNLISFSSTWNSKEFEQFLILNECGIILFILGMLFKLGAFPSHLWTIDIYEGSSNPIMAFFLMPMKLIIFAGFAKIITSVFNAFHCLWEVLLWTSSIMSLIWGSFGAVTEQTIKKFIGYSSINQMGYLLIGITIVYLEGYVATMIYLSIYMITNIVLLGTIFSIRKTIKNERVFTLIDLNSFALNNFKEISAIHIYQFTLISYLFN